MKARPVQRLSERTRRKDVPNWQGAYDSCATLGGMIRTTSLTIAALPLLVGTVCGQIIVADDYNVAGNGTGFALNTGVNFGINPPASRLTGSAASNLRYIPTATKTNTAFRISGNKLLVTAAAN